MLVLFAALAAPVAARIAADPPVSVWGSLVSVTGLVAVAALICAAAAATRPPILVRAVGHPALRELHRGLGAAAAALICGHIAMVVAADPRDVGLLGPDRPPAATAGVVALVAAAALVALAATARHSRAHRWWLPAHLTAATTTAAAVVVHIVLARGRWDPPLVALVLLAAAAAALHTPADTDRRTRR